MRSPAKWIRRAAELAEKWHSEVSSPDLAFFPVDTPEFKREYVNTVR